MYSLFQSLSVCLSQSLICSEEHTNGEVDGQGSYSNRQSHSEITAIDSVSPNSYQLFFFYCVCHHGEKDNYLSL